MLEAIQAKRTFGRHPLWLKIEGQVPGSFDPFARALEERYGLTRAQVAFWDIHEEADKDHSEVGDHEVGDLIVVRHAATEEWQQKVCLALNCSLDMWWQFFEGIEQAIAVS